MADKKVAITGKVEIDQAKATSDLASLKAELAGFKTSLENINTGIGLVLRSLASMAKDMAGTAAGSGAAAKAADDLADATKDTAAGAGAAAKAVDELSEATADAAAEAETVAETFEDVDKSLKPVVEGVKAADDQTKKLNKGTEMFRGLWQRIGHKAIDGLVSSLRGLASYMTSTVGAASDFDAVFDKMSARGVEGVDKIKDSVVELSGKLGVDLLDVAKSVDLAESLGAGVDAIGAAEAAWKNYRVTGMDVNRQLEVSTRLSKAFNMQIGEQAGLINSVAMMAQKAKVSQAALWEGMSQMGPRIQMIGGTFEDLVRITSAGITGGIKSEEEGLQGFYELLNALIKPSTEFGEKLVELGVIATQSSPQWLKLKNSVDAQTTAFNSLNEKVKRYKDLATETGLLADQADRMVEKYTRLNTVVESGGRLNREQRNEYHELSRAMNDQNKELSRFDDLTNTVARSDFRRVAVVDQLATRSERLRDAQKDVNLKMREAQTDAAKVGETIDSLDVSLASVASTLQTEIPGAIQAAIGDAGLPAFIKKLSEIPAALTPLSAEVKTLVTTVGDNLKATVPMMQTEGAAIKTEATSIVTQFQELEKGATDGLNKLKNNVQTIVTQIMTPVSEMMNKVSQIIRDKLEEPFKGSTSIYAAITKWATDVSAKISTDLDQVMAGNVTLGETLKKWFEAAKEQVKNLFAEYVQPMIDAFEAEIKTQLPIMQAKLESWFEEMGSKAGAAFREGLMKPVKDALGLFSDPNSGVYKALQNPGDTGIFQSVLDGLGYDEGSATIGSRGTGPLAAGGTASPGATSNYYINGAQDPNAVAGAVSRIQAQQARLGHSGSRLR